MNTFHEDILAGIPSVLPEPKEYDLSVSHAPKRKDILSDEEKVLAIKNALRYFPQEHHAVLAEEFARVSGYSLEDTPYASSFAGYKDWFIKRYRRPGFTIEVGAGENPLPLQQFTEIYRDNLPILVTAAVG